MTENSRKYKIWEPLLLSLAVVIGMLAGAKLATSGQPSTKPETAITDSHYSGRQVEEIIRFLETKYVGEVSSEALVTKAIQAVMDGLDPHSHYFPPDQLDALEERTSGHYVGIGVEVAFIGDSLVVLFPRKGGPAEKAGLHTGDYILAVNGIDIPVRDSVHRDTVLELIKGDKGSKVRLTVKPMLEKTIRTLEITREDIQIPSVVAAYMMDSSTAYIRIDRFTNSTYREFMDQWEKFSTTKSARDLILDLRDNPGGYMKEAVNILSQMFSEEGKLLVYTEGKNHQRIEYKSTGKVFYPIGNVTVLINEGSASASEIIAGCLQDHDRGLIMGTPSFGKGLVQEQFELSNGGILRLTVSKYYTPSGRLIQKAYDAQSKVDTLAVFKTAEGRPMHAGGGIVPDIMVADDIPWDHPKTKPWMDMVSEYAIRYNLSHYGYEPVPVDQISLVMQQLPADTEILAGLKQIAIKRQGTAANDFISFMSDHQAQILRMAKAALVSGRTGEEGWYITLNEGDPLVQKARSLARLDLQMALKND